MLLRRTPSKMDSGILASGCWALRKCAQAGPRKKENTLLLSAPQQMERHPLSKFLLKTSTKEGYRCECGSSSATKKELNLHQAKDTSENRHENSTHLCKPMPEVHNTIVQHPNHAETLTSNKLVQSFNNTTRTQLSKISRNQNCAKEIHSRHEAWH